MNSVSQEFLIGFQATIANVRSNIQTFMISVITMPFYNGLAVGIGIDELRPFNIPLNILSFIVVLVVQTISLLLAYKDNK